jgi:hypothetical protein
MHNARCEIAKIKIIAMEVLRITQPITQDLLTQGEHDTESQPHREWKSSNETPVEIACVKVDRGWMQGERSRAGSWNSGASLERNLKSRRFGE